MPEIATISADSLSKLTGFSVPDLNTLARNGYFPRANASGQYEQNKAIPGCFKAYQERLQTYLPPLYESMGQCTERTGIPHAVLTAAKKKSGAFRGHRIQLVPLLRWLFADPDGGEIDSNWSDRLKKVQTLRQEIALEKDRHTVISKDDVSTVLSKGMSLLFSLMDRRSNIELPPALKGLPETAIQKRLVDSDEALKNAVRGEFSKLIEIKETT